MTSRVNVGSGESGYLWEMPNPTVATIGVYGASLETFLAALRAGRRDAAPRCQAATRSARPGVRVGELPAAAGRAGPGRNRVPPPFRSGTHDRTSPTAIAGGRSSEGGQAQSQRARPGVSSSLRPRDLDRTDLDALAGPPGPRRSSPVRRARRAPVIDRCSRAPCPRSRCASLTSSRRSVAGMGAYLMGASPRSCSRPVVTRPRSGT